MTNLLLISISCFCLVIANNTFNPSLSRIDKMFGLIGMFAGLGFLIGGIIYG